MSSHIWVPGAAEPSLDEFVSRVHAQIERYTTTHTKERSHVEVELLTLRGISSQPGYGFLTLAVHSADGDPEELIVPVGGVKRITLSPADETRRPGFALPGRKEGPGSAA